MTTYRFDCNQFWADRTKPEVAHFIGGKEESAIWNPSIWMSFNFLHTRLSILHMSSFNFKALNTTDIWQEMSRQKTGTNYNTCCLKEHKIAFFYENYKVVVMMLEYIFIFTNTKTLLCRSLSNIGNIKGVQFSIAHV